METVTSCFKLTFSDEHYTHAVEYVEDMKKHRKRVFWIGKENQSDEELVYSTIAHRILSGFYNTYNAKFGHSQILDMTNSKDY